MTLFKIQNSDNSDQYFYIDKENANKLEIEFNLTEKGKHGIKWVTFFMITVLVNK